MDRQDALPPAPPVRELNPSSGGIQASLPNIGLPPSPRPQAYSPLDPVPSHPISPGPVSDQTHQLVQPTAETETDAHRYLREVRSHHNLPSSEVISHRLAGPDSLPDEPTTPRASTNGDSRDFSRHPHQSQVQIRGMPHYDDGRLPHADYAYHTQDELHPHSRVYRPDDSYGDEEGTDRVGVRDSRLDSVYSYNSDSSTMDRSPRAHEPGNDPEYTHSYTPTRRAFDHVYDYGHVDESPVMSRTADHSARLPRSAEVHQQQRGDIHTQGQSDAQITSANTFALGAPISHEPTSTRTSASTSAKGSHAMPGDTQRRHLRETGIVSPTPRHPGNGRDTIHHIVDQYGDEDQDYELDQDEDGDGDLSDTETEKRARRNEEGSEEEEGEVISFSSSRNARGTAEQSGATGGRGVIGLGIGVGTGVGAGTGAGSRAGVSPHTHAQRSPTKLARDDGHRNEDEDGRRHHGGDDPRLAFPSAPSTRTNTSTRDDIALAPQLLPTKNNPIPAIPSAASTSTSTSKSQYPALAAPLPAFDLTPGRELSPARYKHGEPLKAGESRK
jgi:hypothetical protein